jgi:hypothetical protein
MEDWNTVIESSRHRRQGVEGAGSAGGESDSYAAGSTGIAVGHEYSPLFMANLDMAEGGMIEKGVVNRQRPDSGNAEKGADTFGQE